MRTTDKPTQDYKQRDKWLTLFLEKHKLAQELAEKDPFTLDIFKHIDISCVKQSKVEETITLQESILLKLTQMMESKVEAIGSSKLVEIALLPFLHTDVGKKDQCYLKAKAMLKYSRIFGNPPKKSLSCRGLMASSCMTSFASTPAELIPSLYDYLSHISKKTALARKECLDSAHIFTVGSETVCVTDMLYTRHDPATENLQMILNKIERVIVFTRYISHGYLHTADASKGKMEYYKSHLYETQAQGQTLKVKVLDVQCEEQKKVPEVEYSNQSEKTSRNNLVDNTVALVAEGYLQRSTDLQKNKFNLKNMYVVTREQSYDVDEMSKAFRKKLQIEDTDGSAYLTNTPCSLRNEIDPSDSDAESLEGSINDDPLLYSPSENGQDFGEISQKTPVAADSQTPDAVDEVLKDQDGEKTSHSRLHLDPKHDQQASVIGDDKRPGDERSEAAEKTKLKLAAHTTPKRLKNGDADKNTPKLVIVVEKGERKKDIAMHEKLGDRPFGVADSGQDRHDTLMSSTSSVSESDSPLLLRTDIFQDPKFRLRDRTEEKTSVTTAAVVEEEPREVYDSSSDDSTRFESTEADGTCDKESDICSELGDSFDQEDDLDDGSPETQDDVTTDSHLQECSSPDHSSFQGDQNSFYDDQNSFHDDQNSFHDDQHSVHVDQHSFHVDQISFCETAEGEARDCEPPTPPLNIPVQVCSPGDSGLEFRSYPDVTFYEGDVEFWATLENQHNPTVLEGMYDHENNRQANPHAAVQESGPFNMIGACGEAGTVGEGREIGDGEGNVKFYAENQMPPCGSVYSPSYSSTPVRCHRSGFREQDDQYSPAYSACIERAPRPLSTPTSQSNLPMGAPCVPFFPQTQALQYFNVSGQTQNSPFIQSTTSQSEASGSHIDPARTVLPPIVVHAAGSRPPWASTEARIDLSRAHNREFMDVRSRRATYDTTWDFNTWDLDPASMALAGFFRLGPHGRRVRCFYCGVELDNLKEGDNVWVEHVRRSPSCDYLRAVRGEEDVREIQRRLDRKY